jgi:hypothetical protein
MASDSILTAKNGQRISGIFLCLTHGLRNEKPLLAEVASLACSILSLFFSQEISNSSAS